MRQRERGIVFPMVLIVVTSISVLALAFTTSFTQVAQNTLSSTYSTQAYYLAQGGIDYGLTHLKQAQLPFNKKLQVDGQSIRVQIKKHHEHFLVMAVAEVIHNGQLYQKRISVLTRANGQMIRWNE